MQGGAGRRTGLSARRARRTKSRVYSRPRQTMADQSILKSAVLPASPMPLFHYTQTTKKTLKVFKMLSHVNLILWPVRPSPRPWNVLVTLWKLSLFLRSSVQYHVDCFFLFCLLIIKCPGVSVMVWSSEVDSCLFCCWRPRSRQSSVYRCKLAAACCRKVKQQNTAKQFFAGQVSRGGWFKTCKCLFQKFSEVLGKKEVWQRFVGEKWSLSETLPRRGQEVAQDWNFWWKSSSKKGKQKGPSRCTFKRFQPKTREDNGEGSQVQWNQW